MTVSVDGWVVAYLVAMAAGGALHAYLLSARDERRRTAERDNPDLRS